MRGKSVAISTFGSGSHLAAEVALQQIGLGVRRATRSRSCRSARSPTDGGGGRRPGWRRRLWSRDLARWRKDKGLTVMVRSHQARHPLCQYGAGARQRRYVKENPQQTEAFLKGIIDGLVLSARTRPTSRAVKSVLARRLQADDAGEHSNPVRRDGANACENQGSQYVDPGRRAKHDRRAAAASIHAWPKSRRQK